MVSFPEGLSGALAAADGIQVLLKRVPAAFGIDDAAHHAFGLRVFVQKQDHLGVRGATHEFVDHVGQVRFVGAGVHEIFAA